MQSQKQISVARAARRRAGEHSSWLPTVVAPFWGQPTWFCSHGMLEIRSRGVGFSMTSSFRLLRLAKALAEQLRINRCFCAFL